MNHNHTYTRVTIAYITQMILINKDIGNRIIHIRQVIRPNRLLKLTWAMKTPEDILPKHKHTIMKAKIKVKIMSKLSI